MSRTVKSIRQYGDVNKTAVVECRCDVRSLAGLYKFYVMKNMHVNSKSDLLRLTVDTFYNMLVDSKQITPVEEFDDATNILSIFKRTTRDVKAERHISTYTNAIDFESALKRAAEKSGVVANTVENKFISDPEFMERARLLLEENLKQSTNQYISDMSKPPQLSPEASVCSFDGLPDNIIAEHGKKEN